MGFQEQHYVTAGKKPQGLWKQQTLRITRYYSEARFLTALKYRIFILEKESN